MENKTFENFNEMFDKCAVYYDEIKNRKGTQHEVNKSRYNYEFNNWLREKKGWNNDNEHQYKTFLSSDTFTEYIGFVRLQESEREIAFKKEKQRRQPPKMAKLNASVIKLFCSIVHQSGAMIRGEESAANFCKRVCEEYNLPYMVNLRKNFSESADIKERDRNYIKVANQILPNLPLDKKHQIEVFLESKLKKV